MIDQYEVCVYEVSSQVCMGYFATKVALFGPDHTWIVLFVYYEQYKCSLLTTYLGYFDKK